MNLTREVPVQYGKSHKIPRRLSEEGDDTTSTASFGNFMSGNEFFYLFILISISWFYLIGFIVKKN